MLKELETMRGTLSGLKQQEMVASELGQRRHILTLLGVVSQSTAQSDGKLRMTSLRLTDFQDSGGGGRAGEANFASLILAGQSLDNPSVAELLDRLQESKLFTNVELISLRERVRGRVTKITKCVVSCRRFKRPAVPVETEGGSVSVLDDDTKRVGRLLHYGGLLAAVVCGTIAYSFAYAPMNQNIQDTTATDRRVEAVGAERPGDSPRA